MPAPNLRATTRARCAKHRARAYRLARGVLIHGPSRICSHRSSHPSPGSWAEKLSSVGLSPYRSVGRAGWTLVELLVVAGVLSVLAAIVLPGMVAMRARAQAAHCGSNLRQVGVLIHSFVNSHSDRAAPVISWRDYLWGQGKQIGWDIQTGTWAQVLGGPGSVWLCPAGATGYVGNARALGLDNREALECGVLHEVGVRWWYEPAKLSLAYDLAGSRTELDYQHALDPASGDLSDETWVPWPRDTDRPTVPLELPGGGPHREAYGALFADGHARVDRFRGTQTVLWSGPRWWSTRIGRCRMLPGERRPGGGFLE